MPLPARKPPVRLCVPIMLLAAIPGCTTTGSGVTTDPSRVACQSFSPVYWSQNDTVETVKQVQEHNASWKALCQQGAKP